MRILLITPSQKQIYGLKVSPPYPPLGLLMIGAVLKQANQEVQLIDIDAENYNEERLADYINNFKPNLVGITCVTPTFKAACSAARIVKENSSAYVVLGGIHPTIVLESCLAEKNIDFLVVGEGETTIQELVVCLEKDKKNFEDIKGLWYKKNQKIIKGQPRELINNLDRLPFPAWELISDLGNYKSPDALKHPVMSIMTSRGCPFNCIFCCSKQIFGRRFRTRSKDSLIVEIKHYVDNFGIKELHIMDDVFTLDRVRTKEVCQAIQRAGFGLTISFANGIRVDSVNREILQLLKDTGFHDLGFGVETGDEVILKRIKKGINKEQIRRAFRLSKEYKFNTWGFFIIGLPGETKKTIKKTIDFAIELDPDFAKFLILKPFPGSEVFEELNRKGCIKDFNYDNYGVYTAPVHDLPGLSAEEMLKWQRRAYLRFYLRPKKIIRHLLKIKTLNQFKSNLSMVWFLLNRIISFK